LKPADILELPTSGWDKRIAADLTAEMEQHLAEKVSTIPEMRRFLAVKGYRELREAIERGIAGRSGGDALHALMLSMRRYALERPGMSAATFRNADTDPPEWREAQMQLAGVVLSVFAQVGIKGDQALPRAADLAGVCPRLRAARDGCVVPRAARARSDLRTRHRDFYRGAASVASLSRPIDARDNAPAR
jgi:hypothetical protein